MKRPDLMALYASVPVAPEPLAAKLLDLLVTESKGYLKEYYAQLQLVEEQGEYDAARESLDLKGRNDLLDRVKRDCSSTFVVYLSVGVYPAQIYVSLLADGASGTAVLLRIDPVITRSVEDEPDTRMRVTMFLARVASVIGAEWFISGTGIEQYRPLRVEQLEDVRPWGKLYVVGWKARSLNEAAILNAFEPPPKSVKPSTMGITFFTDFPRVEAS